MGQETNQEFESHLSVIQNDLDDVRRRLEELQKNTLADTNAFVQDILELKKRLDKAEAEITQLKLQPSNLSA